MDYGIYRVRFRDDRLEYWKAPNAADLKAWLHDTYCLNLIDMIGIEIEDVPQDEADKLLVQGVHSTSSYGSILLDLFQKADLGCCLIAIGD